MNDAVTLMSLSSALSVVLQMALEAKLDLAVSRYRETEVDWRERHKMLDQMLVELMAGASRYGFSLEEVLSRLQERQEMS